MLHRFRRHLSRRSALAVAVVIAVAAVAVLVVRPKVGAGSKTTPHKLADTKLAPEPWAGDPKYDPANAPASSTSAPKQPKAAPAPIDPKTGIPAASAGSNGSFQAPSPAERKRVYSAPHPVGGNGTARLWNRTAPAPPS